MMIGVAGAADLMAHGALALEGDLAVLGEFYEPVRSVHAAISHRHAATHGEPCVAHRRTGRGPVSPEQPWIGVRDRPWDAGQARHQDGRLFRDRHPDPQ